MTVARVVRSVALAALLTGGCAAPAASDPATSARPSPSDLAAPGGSPAPADPTVTSGPPAEPAPSPASDLDRATGSGSITVDGETHELEVAVCGWASGGSQSLQSDPGRVRGFQVMAVRRVGTGMLAFELTWNGTVGNIDTAVILLDPSDPRASFRYANDRQIVDLVEIDGGRVRTLEPLTVLDSSNVVTAGRHELEVDITCDSFGGTFAGAAPIVAEITGLEPVAPDAGEVTINGMAAGVDVTRCSRSGADVELEAESADGSITMTLSVTPGFTFLVFSVDGRVLTGAGQVDVEVDADGVSTASPIAGEIAGRGPAEVTFRLPCS